MFPMTTRSQHEKTVPSPGKTIREEDIQGFKYLDSFFKTLKRLHDVRNNHNRELHYDQYIALILHYFFTPPENRIMRTLLDCHSEVLQEQPVSGY
jgi:hypothetical protein